ncbi:MAG: AMP-binding protein, partial [Burkholderiales bacterium]
MSGIESVMHESRLFEPPAELSAAAAISGRAMYDAMCAGAAKDEAAFWGKLAREHLSWKKPFTQVLDESNAPFYRWFHDGELNASYNCLDRQVAAGHGDKFAIKFEADDGSVTEITYKALLARVCRFANVLKSKGIKQGDRVIIYIPMSIEGVVAMQACARIGATHSVVFGGFSAKSLQERIIDAGAIAVITSDEQMRGGKALPIKAIVDEAIAMGGCEHMKTCIVYKRTGGNVTMAAGRDSWWHDLEPTQSDVCEPTWVNAEHPLFIL